MANGLGQRPLAVMLNTPPAVNTRVMSRHQIRCTSNGRGRCCRDSACLRSLKARGVTLLGLSHTQDSLLAACSAHTLTRRGTSSNCESAHQHTCEPHHEKQPKALSKCNHNGGDRRRTGYCAWVWRV